MKGYLEEKGIHRSVGGGLSLEEMVHGSRGDELGSENSYEVDPDYGCVDGELFEYLESVE